MPTTIDLGPNGSGGYSATSIPRGANAGAARGFGLGGGSATPPPSYVYAPNSPRPIQTSIGPNQGGALGAGLGVAIGALQAPARFSSGYRQGYEQAGGIPIVAPASGFIDGAVGVAEGLYFPAALTRPVAEWIGDNTLGRLFNSTSAPERDGPSEPYLTPGQPPFSGGQGVGVSYRTNITLTGTFNGAPNVTSTVGSFNGYTGPLSNFRLVQVNNFFWIVHFDTGTGTITNDGAGGFFDSRPTLSVSPSRADGQPDTDGNPAGLPVAVPGALAQPQTRPVQPQPQPLDMPDPARAPYAQPETDGLPDALVGTGLGVAAATALRNRGMPAVTPAPVGPQDPNAPRTRGNNRCPCNAGIAAPQASANAANAASTAAILAKLQTMQAFAETAWGSTKLNKLINYLTLISVLHNSAMLSRDVASTIGELASNMLATVGIKDETGNQLDINQLVGTSVEGFLKRILGAEVYTDVSVAWHKASRIVSSASMIAYTVRSLHDTSKDVMEWTAENTGKIGNALKRWGVVGERAYPWMSERVKAQDAYRLKFQRFTDGLENLEDTASSLSQVTGNVREIQEEYIELKQQKDAFKALVTDVPPADIATSAPESVPIANTETQAAADSQSTDVAIADAQKTTTP